jgi:hypothetical protein
MEIQHMGYTRRDGQYSGTRDVNFGAIQGATVSADGKSAVVETGPGVIALKLVATAVGASSTLDLTVETSYDGVTYSSAGTFTQITSTVGTQTQYKCFAVGRFTRVDYNIGGSGTQTISLIGDATI